MVVLLCPYPNKLIQLTEKGRVKTRREKEKDLSLRLTARAVPVINAQSFEHTDYQLTRVRLKLEKLRKYGGG
jgi:hypothetical protein